MPASSTLFLVSHADGTVVVYDKEREDGVFTPHDPSSPPPEIGPAGADDKSIPREWDPLDNIFVSMPPWHPVTAGGGLTGSGTKNDKDKTAKNPASHWRVSKRSVVGRCGQIAVCPVLTKPKISCFRRTSSMLLPFRRMGVFALSTH